MEPPRDVLSYLWAPVCAIGAVGPHGPNAQLSVSVFGASIVPERPRLTLNMWNGNYTTELVRERGSLSITMLSEEQVRLLEPLGLRSGRNSPKLNGIDYRLDERGNPVFAGGAGVVACDVLDTASLGDATLFLVAVRDRTTFTARTPLTLGRARQLAPPEVLAKWDAHNERERAASRETMTWR